MGCLAGLVDYCSRDLAFRPPTPATYELIETLDGKWSLQSTFKPANKLFGQVRLSKISTPAYRGAGRTEIVTAWIPFQGMADHRPTLLYSHPNALDLAQCLPNCVELSRSLRVNVLLYDYSGYGGSSGLPSARNSIADITAAFEQLRSEYGKAAHDVVLYGQSVGTGPTVHLASKHDDLAGVILHSPLMSGVRVLRPDCKWWPRWADIFPSYDLIKDVKAPTLIVHGTHDDVIGVVHGQELFKLAPNAYSEPLWAQGFNHQNVEACAEYFPTLQRFMLHVFGGRRVDPSDSRAK